MISIREGKNYSIVSECHEPRIPERFRALPFNKIILSILGESPFTSIAFVRERKMRNFNRQYRKRNYSTDVLSFKLGVEEQILLCLPTIRKKARAIGAGVDDYLSYLLIHALLHLKGLEHGSKMDVKEIKYCREFGIKYPFNKNFQQNEQSNSRDRHRHLPSPGSSGRVRKR